MTPLPAKVTAIGKQGQQYRAVVQIRSKYRGSVTTLVFGELKPHTGFLKGSRLDLVYYLSEPRSERGRSIPPLDSPLKRTKARAERRRKIPLSPIVLEMRRDSEPTLLYGSAYDFDGVN
jgi:hypothetical protein